MRLLILTIIMFVLSLFFITGQSYAQTKGPPLPSARQFILYDELSSRVLLEKNAHDRVSVASITKLMTAVVALEYGDLSDRIKVSKEAVQANGSSIYLEEGEELTLEDLLYGLMLRSGNDAAKAIAEHIGGSEEGFVYLMNETALYLGMSNSHFMNPHGLDEKNHYSSAYDIAILMQYAMENKIFREISQTKSYHSDKRTYPWKNKNKLLTEKFEYTTGGKTGFTNEAGRTLVTTAEKNANKLIVVTLNASDDWNDHIALYDWGFSTYDVIKLEEAGERDFVTEELIVRGNVLHDVTITLNEEEQDKLVNHVYLYKEPRNKQIGMMAYYVSRGTPLLTVPIYETMEESKLDYNHLSERFKRFFKVKQK